MQLRRLLEAQRPQEIEHPGLLGGRLAHAQEQARIDQKSIENLQTKLEIAVFFQLF